MKTNELKIASQEFCEVTYLEFLGQDLSSSSMFRGGSVTCMLNSYQSQPVVRK